jgi:dipeptidase D
MLNLDTEDWGEIFIGCAGGGDSMIKLPVAYSASPTSTQAYEVKVSGVCACHLDLAAATALSWTLHFCSPTSSICQKGPPCGAQVAAEYPGKFHSAVTLFDNESALL